MRRWAPAAASVVIVATVVLLPWHRSGTVERDGFELAGALDAAGLVDTTWRRALLVGVYLLPFGAALAFTAAAAGRARLAGAAAVVTGVVAIAAALVTLDVGGRAAGPLATLAAGLVAVAAGALAVLATGGRT